ncbi:hypothetical protein EVAR_16970_1 [Eumeta japonica]|uniref:Uncharacterized protein n=1 Tax=Eumeta variegata TaxID=151549 RepID=A0A4C1TVW1_EUMVA|nr:hypothetical protein EVAR_16970_1 [Eumeta japonica]
MAAVTLYGRGGDDDDGGTRYGERCNDRNCEFRSVFWLVPFHTAVDDHSMVLRLLKDQQGQLAVAPLDEIPNYANVMLFVNIDVITSYKSMNAGCTHEKA